MRQEAKRPEARCASDLSLRQVHLVRVLTQILFISRSVKYYIKTAHIHVSYDFTSSVQRYACVNTQARAVGAVAEACRCWQIKSELG